MREGSPIIGSIKGGCGVWWSDGESSSGCGASDRLPGGETIWWEDPEKGGALKLSPDGQVRECASDDEERKKPPDLRGKGVEYVHSGTVAGLDCTSYRGYTVDVSLRGGGGGG
ncbi:hypothetical protein TrRE_jg3446, partial [Triparma retinervis]